MNYENAKEGFKKLFVAEMIMIACSVIGAFIPNLWWLFIPAAVGMVVAFFMNLKGLKLIAKDEEGYMKAYTWAWAGIILTVVSSIACVITKDSNEQLYNIFYGLSNTGVLVPEFLVAYFIMKTSIDVCGKINKSELGDYIKKTLTLFQVTYAIAILLGMYQNITNQEILIALFFIALAEAIALIVARVKYYIVLKKMSEAL